MSILQISNVCVCVCVCMCVCVCVFVCAPEMEKLEEHNAYIKGDMDKYKGQGGQNDRLVVFSLFPLLFNCLYSDQ